MQLSAKKKYLNAWELIELIGMGHFTKGINPQTLSIGINEVNQELVMDVIKQVGVCVKANVDIHPPNWRNKHSFQVINLLFSYSKRAI